MRKMSFKTKKRTLEDGYDEYITYAKTNNYRKDSILHYYYSYKQITKILDPKMLLEDINVNVYNELIDTWRDAGLKDMTIRTYIKCFKTIINFCISKEYLEDFPMVLPKVDQEAVTTYSDEELEKLLKKPNIKNCLFTEYRNWVIINFLLSTGVRASSLINIKIKDLDMESKVVNITHTKNRKLLTIPLNDQIVLILKEYLYQRGDDPEDYLFCTIWGKPLNRQSLGAAIRGYNKSRGVSSKGIHKFRHTFAKHFILNGGNVVILQRILGHSDLSMTNHYINILINDYSGAVNDNNILKKFNKKSIKMKKRKN